MRTEWNPLRLIPGSVSRNTGARTTNGARATAETAGPTLRPASLDEARDLGSALAAQIRQQPARALEAQGEKLDEGRVRTLLGEWWA